MLEQLLSPERDTLTIVSTAFIFLIAIGSAAYAWTRQNQIVASFDARLSEQVLRASKNSVVVADDTGTILKVNPGFTAMTGYLPNEAIGKPLSFLRAQRENAEALDEILMAARANGTWEGEVRNRRKSGDFFIPMSWSARLPIRQHRMSISSRWVLTFHATWKTHRNYGARPIMMP